MTGACAASMTFGTRLPSTSVMQWRANVSRSPLPLKRWPSIGLRCGNAARFFSSRYVVPSVPAERMSRSHVIVCLSSLEVSVSTPSAAGSWMTYCRLYPPPSRGSKPRTSWRVRMSAPAYMAAVMYV